MADVKWIKIATDIFDDDKILLIESMPDADSIIVIWFKLLCMAGKQNNSGVFLLNDRIAYTDEMLATIFRRNINTVRLALQTFEQFGMIEIVNNTITIPNWEKHQQLDALEKSRDATRKRVARCRAKQKLLADAKGEKTDCNVTGTRTVTPSNADRIDKNRIDKSNKEDDNNNACARVREEDTPETAPNAYGDADDGKPIAGTAEQYAIDNLRVMTPGNLQECGEFIDRYGVSEDVMKYAIDVACGNGSPVWNYVASILYQWLDAGVKTVGDAKQQREKRKAKREMATPQNARRNVQARPTAAEESADFWSKVKSY